MGKAEETIIEEIKRLYSIKSLEKRYNIDNSKEDLTLLEWLQSNKKQLLDDIFCNQVLQNRLSKLESLCREYKAIREEKRGWVKMMDFEAEIFEEAMKLMLGDGIIDYLNNL